VERITADAVVAARRHVERRIGAIRTAIADAPDADAALAALVDLAAAWTPDALAALDEQASELAALEGRGAVFLELDGAAAAFASRTSPGSGFANGRSSCGRSARHRAGSGRISCAASMTVPWSWPGSPTRR